LTYSGSQDCTNILRVPKEIAKLLGKFFTKELANFLVEGSRLKIISIDLLKYAIEKLEKINFVSN
jgi:hypothetical protein